MKHMHLFMNALFYIVKKVKKLKNNQSVHAVDFSFAEEPAASFHCICEVDEKYVSISEI